MIDVKVKEFVLKNQAKQFANYLVANSHLPGRMANLRLVQEVAETFAQLKSQSDFKTLYTFILQFKDHKHEYVRLIVGNVLGAIGDKYYSKVFPLLKILADDTSWRVREGAADGIGRLLCDDFEVTYQEICAWVRSGKPNLQRAAAVGMISMVSYDVELLKNKTNKILNLLEKLLTVDHEYVRKNMSFALNITGWKNPSVVIPKISQWLRVKKINSSPVALRIFIDCLHTRFGKQNAVEAKKILGIVNEHVAKVKDIKERERLKRLSEKTNKYLKGKK